MEVCSETYSGVTAGPATCRNRQVLAKRHPPGLLKYAQGVTNNPFPFVVIAANGTGTEVGPIAGDALSTGKEGGASWDMDAGNLTAVGAVSVTVVGLALTDEGAPEDSCWATGLLPREAFIFIFISYIIIDPSLSAKFGTNDSLAGRSLRHI